MTVTAFRFGEYEAGVWVTELTNIISYRYKKHFYHIGEFSLSVLGDDPGDPSKIREGMILYVKDEVCDSLVITCVSVTDGRYTFTGYDMKYILTQRITLFPPEEIEAGTYGYDCRQGWTGNIIKGYIDYNICEAEDEKRKMPGVYCLNGDWIGIPDDTYMSRLQPLNEVVEALCENAKIGYDVSFSPKTGSTAIRPFEGDDKRYSGYPFGTGYGNVDSIKLTRGNEKLKNTVWAVNGTNADNSTVTAVHLDYGDAAGGFERRETVAQMNCDQEDIEVYARHAVENCVPTKEIDISGAGAAYGKLFNVGDAVRVFFDADTAEEMRISAVEKNYSASSERIKVFFEDYENPSAENAVLNTLSNEQKKLEKEALDQVLDDAGTSYTAGTGVYINDDNIISVQPPDSDSQKRGGIFLMGSDTGLSVDGDGGITGRQAEIDKLGMLRLGDGLEYHYYPDGSRNKSTGLRLGDGLEFIANDPDASGIELIKDNRYRGRRFRIKCGENMGFDDDGGLICLGGGGGDTDTITGTVVHLQVPNRMYGIKFYESGLGNIDDGNGTIVQIHEGAATTINGISYKLTYWQLYDPLFGHTVSWARDFQSNVNRQLCHYFLFYLPNMRATGNFGQAVSIPEGIYLNLTRVYAVIDALGDAVTNGTKYISSYIYKKEAQ